MEHVYRVVSESVADAYGVISKSFQERFRNMLCFLVGVIVSLLCNLILVARASGFVQMAAVVTILSSVAFVAAGFAQEWKQVGTSLQNNVLEVLKNNVPKKAFWQLVSMVGNYTTSLLSRIKETTVNIRLSEFASSLPSTIQTGASFAVGWVSSRFFRSNSSNSSTTERSSYQIAKELFSAFIMGIIVGTTVHLAIKLMFYLIYSKVASMLFSLASTVIQFFFQTLHLPTVIYSALVALLSIAAVVVFVATY